MMRLCFFIFFGITLGPSLAWSADLNEECRDLLSLHDPSNSYDTHYETTLQLMQVYQQGLGVYQNPFATAWTVERGERIFSRLLVLQEQGQWVPSPLSTVLGLFRRSYSERSDYDHKTIEEVLSRIEILSMRPTVEILDLQSHLLALKYALHYINRYRPPEKTVDRDGNSQPHPSEEKPQESKKNQTEEEDFDPEYPDLPKEYKPFTKNSDQSAGSGKKQKKHRISEVNFKTPFFGQRYFAEIVRGAAHPFREVDFPASSKAISKFERTSYEMVVRTFGKSQVDLFMPPSFKPLEPSDSRAVVSRSDSGGYTLSLSGGISEVVLPLVEEKNVILTPDVLEVYLRPVGFRLDEWPDLIQAEILRKFSREEASRHPLKIAQAIADHISGQYLYSVGPRSETDPIDALNAGAFQCDMASYIMVGLLRDVFQIPARVVGGYRAKQFKNGQDGKSYLIVPGEEAHAWVEVFDQGRWHLFDPTPIKKDKASNQDSEGEHNEYLDQRLDNTLTPPQENPKQKKAESEAVSSPDEHKKRMEEASEARVREVKDAQASKDSSEKRMGEESKSLPKNPEESDIPMMHEDLVNQLELGSLELEPQWDQNVLVNRLIRVLMQLAFDPTQSGNVTQERLSHISSLVKRHGSVGAKMLYQDALAAHSKSHPDLKNWIDQVVLMMSQQDINRTYHDIHQIHLALASYARVLDVGGKIPRPDALLATLEWVKYQLSLLNHPDSQDIGLVNDFTRGLPPVARMLLKEQFDLSIVGPNAPTREVARQLKSGALNDLRLVSILGPLSDFILNSTPRPERVEVRTWQRDMRQPRGRELLLLQRLSDLGRVILGQPGRSLEENIQAETAYVPVHRQRISVPLGHGKDEAERVTIVLYDTSASMSGDPGDFQAGLISAFVAKALSDVSPSGRHRHRALLVPFDSDPGEPIRVNHVADALDVIRDYRQKLKNTNGSTDIQKALIQAMSLIADAEKRSGEPLAAANIILMTDGGAEIDTEALLKARNAIDRSTPLQTMFVAINQSNEELLRFVLDSKRMGMEKGFYREFTSKHIEEILAEARTLDLSHREYFFTERNVKDVPDEVYRLMNEALRLAREFSDQVRRGSQYLDAKEHLEHLEQIKWQNVAQVDRPLEKWLIRVRRVIKNPLFRDQHILNRVVDDWVRNFEQITGVQLNQLSHYEQEHLRHLVRFAAGLED